MEPGVKDLSASVPQWYGIRPGGDNVAIPSGPVLSDRAPDHETPNARPYVPLWASADMTPEHLISRIEDGTIWDMLTVTDKPLAELTTIKKTASTTTLSVTEQADKWALFYRKLAFDQFSYIMDAIFKTGECDITTGIRAAFTDLAIN